MKSTFTIEAFDARQELAEIALQYPVRDHLELRTAIDTLLTVYDEAVILATKMIQIAELYQEIKDLKQR